jgi:hypothetical protein
MVSPHRVPSPRLLAWALPLLAAACATTSGDLRSDCEQRGNTYACSEWGRQLLLQGEKQQAENAFVRSCEGDYLQDCVTQGRLMLERGELAGAEAPLRKGYEAESEEATWALADLYQARAGSGDMERAEHLRWQAPAIDKPDRELTFWWRPSPTGEPTYALAYTFQPMVFFSRRMVLGVHVAGNARGSNELNAAIGYQHFLSSEIVPYGTLLLGGAFQQRSFNAGAEVGVKLCLGALGHLNAGMGTSVGSPPHISIGLGINSLPVELLVLLGLR